LNILVAPKKRRLRAEDKIIREVRRRTFEGVMSPKRKEDINAGSEKLFERFWRNRGTLTASVRRGILIHELDLKNFIFLK
jgi:hypothetical protein